VLGYRTFLGDPPPDPRFLASLGALLAGRAPSLPRSSARAERDLGVRLSDFLGDPPPDPRFLASLGALFVGRAPSLSCSSARAEHDLVVGYRPSWGILPQIPVSSLHSARCHLYSSITPLTEHPGPKDLLVNHRTSWGILLQTPVFSLRSVRCSSVELHLCRVTDAQVPTNSLSDRMILMSSWSATAVASRSSDFR
jgi:hypothetical protein